MNVSDLLAVPGLWVAAAAVVGLCVGSFLNVVVHRLPRMLEREWADQCAELRGEPRGESRTAPYNLVVPRSACPHCGHPIRALENVPVLSWIVLRGRCASCRAPISVRYPAVELLCCALSGFLAWHFGPTVAGAAALLFAWAMIALAFIDVDTQLLPDDITLPLLWAGLAFNLGGTFAPLPDAVVGAIAGYGILWGVYWLFKLATGKEGMGYGDFKLLAAIGAWLGWPSLPVVILLASCAGALVGIGLILAAKLGRGVPMPFGPYLATGGLVALVWGRDLTGWYMGML